MKSTKRALRRHHRGRMIRRAERSSLLGREKDPDTQRQCVLGWSDNLAKCSCWMCGNPRKFSGCPTVQERRDLQAAVEDLDAARAYIPFTRRNR